MTFGRPSAIPEHYVGLPLPQPFLIVTGDVHKQRLLDMSVKFFNGTMYVHEF